MSKFCIGYITLNLGVINLLQEYLISRIIQEAEFIINTGATVRKTAKMYCLGKSTVHKDVTERLKEIDRDLYKKVDKVLKQNLAERHIRGGEATKRKYLTIKRSN